MTTRQVSAETEVKPQTPNRRKKVTQPRYVTAAWFADYFGYSPAHVHNLIQNKIVKAGVAPSSTGNTKRIRYRISMEELLKHERAINGESEPEAKGNTKAKQSA